MMNKIYFPVFAAILLLSACKKDPVACFTLNSGNDAVDVGHSVAFSNCSFVATKFAWDFGDGATSIEFTPVHTYTTPGNYTVTLVATTDNGSKSSTETDVVKVGTRVITSIKVNSIPATDSLSNPWDASDAADLVLKLGPVIGLPSYSLSEN